MARRHVASHVKKLQMHQQRHRKNVWKIFKKLARHKACYDKGGMMLMGMGMRKKKKAGMMLYGMGLRKRGYKKRTIKLPAWVTKPIPKKGKRFPNVPKGFSKRAGWFWSKHKKNAEKKQSKAAEFIGRIWKTGKETVKKVGTQALETAKKHAKVLADQGMKILNDHADEFSDLASKFIDSQADKYAGKASAALDKYGKKKGSGIQFNLIRKAATDIALQRSRQRARASGAGRYYKPRGPIRTDPSQLVSASSLAPGYLQQNRGTIQQAIRRAANRRK